MSFATNYEKENNAWKIRCLGDDDESFVPVNQQTGAVYCRLSDLRKFLKAHLLTSMEGYTS